MSDLNRVIAGVSCREVLADLSAFIDGQLPEERVQQLRTHVATCRACEQFGAHITSLVEALRAIPEADEPLPPHLRSRVQTAIRDAGKP